VASTSACALACGNGGGAPCRRTSTATLSATRSQSAALPSAVAVNS
jgi:hypothetical protein